MTRSAVTRPPSRLTAATCEDATVFDEPTPTVEVVVFVNAPTLTTPGRPRVGRPALWVSFLSTEFAEDDTGLTGAISVPPSSDTWSEYAEPEVVRLPRSTAVVTPSFETTVPPTDTVAVLVIVVTSEDTFTFRVFVTEPPTPIEPRFQVTVFPSPETVPPPASTTVVPVGIVSVRTEAAEGALPVLLTRRV